MLTGVDPAQPHVHHIIRRRSTDAFCGVGPLRTDGDLRDIDGAVCRACARLALRAGVLAYRR